MRVEQSRLAERWKRHRREQQQARPDRADGGTMRNGDRAAAESGEEEGSEGWQMGNAGVEAATAAAEGAAGDGPGAAAEAGAGAAAGVRPPRPDNDGQGNATATRRTLPQEEWDKMTRVERKDWKKRGGKLR